MNKIDELYLSMMDYEAGFPEKIQHLIKVHSFARMIAIAENLTPHERYTLEAAALLEGTDADTACGEAGTEKILQELFFDISVVRRVSYLVRHHAEAREEDLGCQILAEAGWLVNLHEKKACPEEAERVYRTVFRTQSGRKMCRDMFSVG